MRIVKNGNVITSVDSWLAAAPPKPFTQVSQAEGITEYALPNGLKVLLAADESQPTVTVNARPACSPACGVITSSCPSRMNVAGRPSTANRVMSKPRRSRSNRERFWVAVAWIVAVPSSRRVAGS